MDAAKLDRLLAAHHALGMEPDLRRGATEDEIDAVEALLSRKLPEAVRTLWSWHDGCLMKAGAAPKPWAPLTFRDNWLIGTHEVEPNFELVKPYFDGYLGGSTFLAELSEVGWVPIAANNGDTYVVSCGPLKDCPGLDHPVIQLFEGLALAFNSVESMIDTCIEYLEHPEYQTNGAIYFEIRDRLNQNEGYGRLL